MRIKLKSNIFGAWKGIKGEEHDRPDAEAAKLIAGGFAEPVKAKEQLETAVLAEATEKAIQD